MFQEDASTELNWQGDTDNEFIYNTVILQKCFQTFFSFVLVILMRCWGKQFSIWTLTHPIFPPCHHCTAQTDYQLLLTGTTKICSWIALIKEFNQLVQIHFSVTACYTSAILQFSVYFSPENVHIVGSRKFLGKSVTFRYHTRMNQLFMINYK